MENNKTVSGKEVVIENAIDNDSYELGIINRTNEISALEEQKKTDFQMLSGYVVGNDAADMNTYGITDMFHEAVAELEKIKEMMQSDLTWESAWNSLSSAALSSFKTGREQAIDTFMTMIEPLTAAVITLQENVLSKMGIPNIPVIGNIQQILVQLGNIGRVVSRLSAKQRKEARDAAKAEEEKKGGTMLSRLYEGSVVEKIVKELVDLFYQALDLLQKIIALIEPFLIMMLLEKIKPIVEEFGIAIGEIYGMAENAYTIGKMVIFNQAQLLNMFAEVIRSKIEELWDVVRFVIHGGSLPNDAMISAIAMDIVCCDFQIEANRLDIDLIRENQKLYSDEVSLEELKKKEKKGDLEGQELKAEIEIGLPQEINGIKNGTIPMYGKRIEDYNKNLNSNFEKRYTALVAENLAKKIEIAEKKTAPSTPAAT